jgi:hypothetical protein
MIAKNTISRNNILLLAVVLAISLLLPVISAATDTNNVDDIFRVNTEVNYAKPCFNNGSYCSAASTCNFTVYNPDNTILVDNQLATNQISYHNISFTVTTIGIYQVDMTCIDVGLNGAETLYFEVTGSGFNSTIWFYLIIILVAGGTIALGFWLQDAPIVLLGSFGLYFLGIYILFFGIVGIKDLTTTWATGLIILGLAAYISTKSAYELVTDSS